MTGGPVLRGPLGVLLMTYGSPASPEDMPRYLAAVRGGREPAPDLVAEFRRRYEAIGGSPLIRITAAQAPALQTELARRGIDARATIGMRFSEPTIAAGLVELANAGCRTVVGIVMSPQHSDLLMSGYSRALAEAAEGLAGPAVEYRIAPAWYREPAFLDAVAQRVTEALARLAPAERDQTPVLLTAHSLPRRVADAEPGYLRQLRETAELVAARSGLAGDRWHFCWQSAGHEPGEWMRPDFADLIPQLRSAGHAGVVVAPIQFLADHLEVLYDIDIGARQQAESAGMRFARIESLNVMPRFIGGLADVAIAQAAAPRARPAEAAS